MTKIDSMSLTGKLPINTGLVVVESMLDVIPSSYTREVYTAPHMEPPEAALRSPGDTRDKARRDAGN